MRGVAIGLMLASLAVAMPAAAQDEVRQGGAGGKREHAPILPPTVSKMTPVKNPYRDPLVDDPRFDRGMEAIGSKNPQQAIALMQPILDGFEKRYGGEKRQIYCAITKQQAIAYMGAAAKEKRDAVSIEPAWCRAQYIRAFALVDLDRLDEAQQAYQRLVGYAPQNSRYLSELGYVFQKKKQWQQSLDIYRRSEVSADLSPDGTDNERCVALHGIGYDLIELGKYDEAEVAYRKCLAINPDDDKSQQELKYIADQRKNTV